MTFALNPRWPWYHYQPADCDCGAPDMAEHRPICAVTPIYAQTHADTNQPGPPWMWPWLVMGFPECGCDDGDPTYCMIHGRPEWLNKYMAVWLQ